jgi:VWFA-related protein
MRVFSPLALIPILCFSCLSVFAQERATVRVGVAVLRNGADTVSGTEARNRLVRALNQHKSDEKTRFSIEAVALDTAPGRHAIAEGSDKKCEFVLYTRVEALERSSRSGQNSHGSSQNLDGYAALLEYELRRVSDGAPDAIGTTKGESDSGWDAILDAIRWVPNKVVADLRNSRNAPPGGPNETGSMEQTAPALNRDEYLGADSCAALPKAIPHSDALRRVCEHAVTQSEKMPNFVCEQETSRYTGHNRVPTDLVTATIRYVDGKESFSDLKRNGRPLPGGWWNSAGLWSSGQFEGNLRAIFHPDNHAVFAFSGENKAGEHAAWVFTYQVARQYEPLWELRSEDQLAAPPYVGELWVDEKTGDVLRFRSTAKDVPALFPIRSAEILTDYDNVAFPDGTSFLLPVKSTVATRHRQEELTRNVVEFHGCHKFRATARMILDAPPGTPDAERSIVATSAEQEVELEENEKIYAILREQAIAEDAARLNLEQQQELKGATGEVFWKIAQLEKKREKVLVADARNTRPDSSYKMVTNPNGSTTFTVNVRLVQVSTVVRDNKGRAVGSLSQEAFQLFDDRKVQEIVSFSVEKGAGAQDAKERASAGGDRKPAASNNVAYVFDDLHTAFGDLAKAKLAAERHLSLTAPDDRTAVFTTSGEVALDFTADHEKLQAALRKIKSHSSASPADCPAMSYYVADAIVNQADSSAMQLAMEDTMNCTFPDAGVGTSFLGKSGPGAAGTNFQQQGELEKSRRTVLAKAVEVAGMGKMESDRTLAMLHDVLDRTVSQPARRSVVLLSPGFLTLTREQQKAAMYLIERALRAGVVFNALDARGLASTSLAPNRNHINEPTETRTLDSQESSASGGVLEDLAYGTGGTYFHNNNDLDEGLRRTADAPEYVYVLGFSPQKLDGKLHKLKVKLNGPTKLTVQARQGYYALKPASGQ